MLALMMFDLRSMDYTQVLINILTFVIATAMIFLSIWLEKKRSDPDRNWFHSVWDEEDSDDDNWGPWTGN